MYRIQLRLILTVVLFQLTYLLILFSPTWGQSRDGSFFVNKIPKLNKAGFLYFKENKLRPWNSVKIEEVEDNCEWWGDCYLIKFNNTRENNSIAELRFDSSYGSFDAGFVDLTGDAVEELLLISGKGHGTGVRSELLTIYQLKKTRLEKIIEIPVSNYFGPGVLWWYRISLIDDNHNKARYFTLELEHSSYKDKIASPELIPKINKIEYKWSSSENKFIERSMDNGN